MKLKNLYIFFPFEVPSPLNTIQIITKYIFICNQMLQIAKQYIQYNNYKTTLLRKTIL